MPWSLSRRCARRGVPGSGSGESDPALTGEALHVDDPRQGQRVATIVGDVVHPGAALGQELADRRVVSKRREQLDTALANPNGRRLDALLGDGFPPLDFGTEEPAVRVDGLVEILDRHPEMVDPLGLHAQGCYPLL